MNSSSIDRIYKNERRLTPENATKILKHLDKAKFEEYIERLSPDARSTLATVFKAYFNDTDFNNVGTKCAELFTNILAEAAGVSNLNSPAETPDFCTTINKKGFESVFMEVFHQESLGLKNPNSIHLFRLNIANCTFMFENLQDFLENNIGRYVFSRATRDQLIKEERVEHIGAKAIALIKQAGGFDNTRICEELGDLILYTLLEQNLGAPKIYNKIELASIATQPLVNQGGVHLLSLGNNAYQVIISKSNIIDNLQAAIDNAFTAITTSHTNSQKELQILDSAVLAQSFDVATTEYLKSIIIPSKRNASNLVNNAYGVFLGYSIGLDSSLYSIADFSQAVEEKMAADLKEQLPYINLKISSAGLNSYSFYFYLLPFNDANGEKLSIMKNLCGGGV